MMREKTRKTLTDTRKNFKKAKTKEKADSKNTIGDANEQLKELKNKMDGK